MPIENMPDNVVVLLVFIVEQLLGRKTTTELEMF